MKSLIIGVVVVSSLIAAGVGGTFAGFVDTEISENNFYQAGISDLLVNGRNDPVGAQLTFTHGVPCISQDFWIDIYNWGECQGSKAYMHIKDVESIEAGVKNYLGTDYIYDGVATLGDPVPDGYDVQAGVEPVGAGAWSSEPEKISEVGDGMVGQIYIRDDDANLLTEDYASGISDHLDVTVVTYVDAQGILVDIDDDGDGVIQDSEEAAHSAELVNIFAGKMKDIECVKKLLGILPTQEYGWIHMDVHLQQITAYETDPDTGAFVLVDGNGEKQPWPEPQRKYWPTNALQGDQATWSMLFELNTDP